VRKLELLTGKIEITLTAEQSASVTTALADIEKAEKMSDDDAKAKCDALMALLDNDQKSLLDAIGLPRPQRGPGGPGGPGGSPGGPGGSPPAADVNPFQQETNTEALKSLRQRFAPAAPKEAAGESKPPSE
jgi:hypothetical protein